MLISINTIGRTEEDMRRGSRRLSLVTFAIIGHFGGLFQVPLSYRQSSLLHRKLGVQVYKLRVDGRLPATVISTEK